MIPRYIPYHPGSTSPQGKGWKKILQANGLKKQASVVNLISDKLDFKQKLIRRDKEGHYTLTKGKIHQEDNAIANIDAPNITVPKFIKERLLQLKSHIEPHTVITADFNIPLL